MRPLPSPWIFLASLCVTLLIVYLGRKRRQARLAAWAEFASRHDMHAQNLHVEGAYEGYPLVLQAVQRGSGKHSQMITMLRLSLNEALPPEFSLRLQGLGGKVLRAFGRRDAEIGDEEFDKRFSLEGVSDKTASLLRSSSVQQHLYALVDLYHDFQIRNGWIEAERPGVPTTADGLEELTGPALMLAHTLEESARRARNRTPS